MRYLPLGQTGLTVSEVGFGGIPIIRLSSAEAERTARHALDAGITLFDTANRYLDSEEKLGRALRGVRHRAVLATKTFLRDAKGAAQELDLSLQRLQTDWIDLYQIHQVSQQRDLDAALAPGGALEALLKAKEQGKIRHIGVSSHNLAMAERLVETNLFETIQYPLNFVEREAATTLVPKARAAGLGVLVMKPFAGGVIDDAALAFAYLRRFPEVIPLPGLDSVERVDEILALYARPHVLAARDEAAMEIIREELGARFCRRCEYCQPCPHGVRITYAMMYLAVARRMSPAKATGFSGAVMETVRACADCGECLPKCPYGLPIPDMLKERLALYDEHRRQLGQD